MANNIFEEYYNSSAYLDKINRLFVHFRKKRNELWAIKTPSTAWVFKLKKEELLTRRFFYENCLTRLRKLRQDWGKRKFLEFDERLK